MSQIKPLPRLFGNTQVAVVNGIKGPAKDAKPLHELCNVPVTLADFLTIATLLPNAIGIQRNQNTGDQKL
jgi:hypothetical protein